MLKKDKKRIKRRITRVRKNIFGTVDRPRLTVFRSLNNIYAQVIDDTKGITLVSASTLSQEISEAVKGAKSKIDKSKLVGELVAKSALDQKIEKVVFDRGSCAYHGRVKAVADAAREAGLKI